MQPRREPRRPCVNRPARYIACLLFVIFPLFTAAAPGASPNAPPITVPHCVAPHSQVGASVPFILGHSYSWQITGTGVTNISSFGATASFTSGDAGTVITIQVIDTSTGCSVKSTETVQVNFGDEGSGDFYYGDVCTIGRLSITAGCGGGNYCPTIPPLTRAQMAVLILKAEHVANYVPPGCTGLFSDVACPSQYAAWIEQLYNEGITAGCGASTFCPNDPITRAQMAVFMVKVVHGTCPPGQNPANCYQAPAASGAKFTDVPAGAFAAAEIEQLLADGHVAKGACSGAGEVAGMKYCPGTPTPPTESVTRAQMARFIKLTFGLQ
jgi:hypothetical protein